MGPELEKEMVETTKSGTRANLRQFLKNNSSKTEDYWRFYSDGRFVNLANGRYRAGGWELNKKTGLLTMNIDKNHVDYRVERQNTRLVLWELGREASPKFQTGVALQPNDNYQNGDLDLLSPSRNTWRRKPTHPEMFKDLKKRLTDQLTYMIDYFEMVEKKGQGYFSTNHLNAPFRFYSGGMGLFNFNELPAEWLGQFYNEGDALVAHVLLTDAFRSGITYPSGRKSHTEAEAYARFLKQVKIFVLAQEEPETLPVQ